MKIPRNSPCPCGSGRKFKHCCGKISGRQPGKPLDEWFVSLPQKFPTHYFDTCVWGTLIEQESMLSNFVEHFIQNEYVAVLSQYTIFELSRAQPTFNELNALLQRMRHHVWIPCLYDYVIGSEIQSYPEPWNMKWFPVLGLVGDTEVELLHRFANHPDFVASRDEHLKYGSDNFMNLEQFKQNFPPRNGKRYSLEDVDLFTYTNMIEYLSRHFAQFFRDRVVPEGPEFKRDKLPSLYIRSLFLFFKYYLYNQSPLESDFLDFAQVSYAPYCDVFVTERNASNALKHIQKEEYALKNTRIVAVADFVEEIRI